MNDENQKMEVNKEQSLEPIILGELKKDSTGIKGFFVIIIMIVAGVWLALPAVQAHLSQSEGWLGQLYSRFFPDDDGEFYVVSNDTIHQLNNQSNIVFDDIRVTNVRLEGNQIFYTIYTVGVDNENNPIPINLNRDTLYLEVLGSNNNLLSRVKLVDDINQHFDERSFTFTGLTFNPDLTYFGRVQRLEEDDYPDFVFTITEDPYAVPADPEPEYPYENGEYYEEEPVEEEEILQIMICTRDNLRYTYYFENYKLITLRHHLEFSRRDWTTYTNTLTFYRNSSLVINGFRQSSASVEENEAGLIFRAHLFLEHFTLDDLGEYVDYNFHEFERSARRIAYQMRAQGFDCR